MVAAACGAEYSSSTAAARHSRKCYKCYQIIHGLTGELDKVKRKVTECQQAQVAATEEETSKKARTACFKDTMRYDVAMSLADMRFLKQVEGTTVDEFKKVVVAWNVKAFTSMKAHLSEMLSGDVLSSVLSVMTDHLDWFDQIETEALELRYLRDKAPVKIPKERPLPGKPGRFAYDFMLDEELMLILEYVPAAREQIYQTVVDWRTRPDPGEEVIYMDITDGQVFKDHPILGLKARVSFAEAEAACETAPLNIGLIIYNDGFTAIKNQLSGVAHDHEMLFVGCAVINLSPTIRMTIPCVIVVTLVNGKYAKDVGMVEIINGGSTSLGAQLREFYTPQRRLLRSRDGKSRIERDLGIYAVCGVADFPAHASWGPFKGSVSARSWDRLSNIDDQHEHYWEANSLLRCEFARIYSGPSKSQTTLDWRAQILDTPDQLPALSQGQRAGHHPPLPTAYCRDNGGAFRRGGQAENKGTLSQ